MRYLFGLICSYQTFRPVSSVKLTNGDNKFRIVARIVIITQQRNQMSNSRRNIKSRRSLKSREVRRLVGGVSVVCCVVRFIMSGLNISMISITWMSTLTLGCEEDSRLDQAKRTKKTIFIVTIWSQVSSKNTFNGRISMVHNCPQWLHRSWFHSCRLQRSHSILDQIQKTSCAH